MALRDVKAMVTITTNAVKAVEDGKKLKQVYADINQQLQQMKAAGKSDTPQFKQMQKLAEDTKARIDGLLKGMKLINKVMSDLSGHIGTDLNRALRESSKEFNKTSSATEKGRAKLERLREAVANFKKELSDRKGLTMSFTDAQKQMNNLNNTKLDKLKQGLAAVRAELDNPNIGNKWRRQLEQMAAQYQAAIVSRQTPMTNPPVYSMNAQQLKAEQAALNQALGATQGIKGYEQQAANYAARLKEINEQLKAMEQNEKAADAAAKELQATQEASKVVQQVMNGQNVSLEQLTTAYKALEAQSAKYAGVNPAKAQAAIRQMEMLRQRIQQVNSTMLSEKDIQDRIAHSGKYTVAQLQQAYDQLQMKLQTLHTNDITAIKETRKQMKLLQKDINNATGQVTGFAKAWQTAKQNIMMYVGVFAIVNKIKTTISDLWKKNLEFSDELTNIRKVSQLTEGDINNLAVALAKIDTRSSVHELNNLAYAGAKLGMQEHGGVAALESFVRAADKVNVALKEDLGEDALTAMSKLVEVMGLIPKMGIEKSMDAAGSAIFMLSTSSTATGANIIEFSKRLMGLANVSHVAVEELLALGSASDAMGLMPEVSATAFNKVFTSIQTNTRGIAKALGDTQGELQALIDQGKTMEGIVFVLEKMHNMSMQEMKGRGLFKALGSDGARLNNVIATMANRIDMLKDHLDISNEAFEEAIAIQKEYDMQMESAAGYAERASNVWEKAFVNPEGVDLVKQLAMEWYNLSREITSSQSRMALIKGTLGMIAELVKTLIKYLPELVQFFMMYGVVRALRFVYLQVVALAGALNSAATAGARLNAVMKSNLVMFAASAALTLITTKIMGAADATEEFTEKQKTLNDYLSEAEANYIKSSQRIDTYLNALRDASLSEEKRTKILKKFNSEFGGYLTKLGLEVNSVNQLQSAYSALNTELRKKAYYEMEGKVLEEQMGPQIRDQASFGISISETIKEMGLDGILSVKDMNDAINKALDETEDKTSITSLRKNTEEAVANVVAKALAQRYNYTDAHHLELSNDFDEVFAVYQLEDGTFSKKKIDEGEQIMYAVRSLADGAAAIEKETNVIHNAFKSFYGDYNPIINEIFNGDYDEGPTKDEIKEEKERLLQALKDAKQKSDAVISKIEEWYRLQETVITDMQADGKLTKEQAEQVVRTLNIAKNTALRDARLAISGRDTKAWETTKKDIGNLMLDQGEWSTELLQQILDVSMESIRENLANIDAGGGQYGITSTSLKDAVDKNAAGNQREIAKLRAQSQQEVEKILLEYHYVETAIKGFSNRLAQMGILTETAQQMSERLSDANNADKLFSMKDYDKLLRGNELAKKSMLQAFLNSGNKKYGVNPEDKEQLREWFMEFVGEYANDSDATGGVSYQYKSWAKPFEKDFELWLEKTSDYLPQIQAFYFSLIKTEDDYYDAMKKAYQKQKTLFSQRWEYSGRSEYYDNLQKQLNLRNRQLSLTGKDKGTNLVDLAGFDEVNEDPEIAMSIARMQQAKEELELFKKTVEQKKMAGEELAAFQKNLREKEIAATEAEMALQEQLMKSINDRISKLQEWTAPIETFGTEVGQALYDQWHNGESMTAKWQDMLKKMGLAWGQLTIKIVSELMMQRIKQNIIDKAMQADAIKHQATMSTIEQTGGQARQLVQQTTDQALIQGNQVTNTVIETQQQAHNAATLSEDAGQAAAENPVNISRAAGKTLADLGWWGIPLVAVVTALLNALLQAALGSSSKKTNSNSSTSNSNEATKIKLVSGMLTYDEGNVGTYAGTDGHVYRAASSPAPGTGLITRPIATTVQGNPALVAERGPEIVIGRRATANIMRWNPALLNVLASYDPYSRRRTYDEGTPVPAAVPSASPDGQTDPRMETTLASLAQTVALLSATVSDLQKKGIPAHINKYGTGGLIDEVKSGLKFDARYSG